MTVKLPDLIAIAGAAGSGKDTVAALLRSKYLTQTIALADSLKRKYGVALFGIPKENLWGASYLRNLVDGRAAVSAYWDEVDLKFDGVMRSTLDLFPNELNSFSIYRGMVDAVSELRENPSTFTPRKVLQVIGTDFARNLWEDVWLNQFIREMNAVKLGARYSPYHGAVTSWTGEKYTSVVIPDARFPNEWKYVREQGGAVLWVDASSRIKTDAVFYQHSSETKYEDIKPYLTGVIDNNDSLDELPSKLIQALKQ